MEYPEKVAYNIACIYSLIKNKSKCYENLKIAIFLGYNNFSHIKKDSDLNWIRQTSGWKKWSGIYLQQDIWVVFPREKLFVNYFNKEFVRFALKSGSPTKASNEYGLSGLFCRSFGANSFKLVYLLGFHQVGYWGNFTKVFINKKRNKLKLVSKDGKAFYLLIKGSSKSGELKDYEVKELVQFNEFGYGLGRVEMFSIAPFSWNDYMISVMFKKRYRTKNGKELHFRETGYAVFLGKRYRVEIQLDGNSPGGESIFFKETKKDGKFLKTFRYRVLGEKLRLYYEKEIKGGLPEKGKLAYEFESY